MPLKLVPATFSDLPKIAQIEEASFASNPLTPIFFPGDKTAETDDAYVESLLQKWQDNLALRTKTVVDTDLNDAIIAFARWFVFVGEDVRFIKTEAGVGGDESGDGASQRELPGSNPEALADFFGALAKLRMELIGERPHCCKCIDSHYTRCARVRAEKQIMKSSMTAADNRLNVSQI